MTEEDWSSELALLRDHGATPTPGLTAEEIRRVEELHRFRFPPDLRSLLSCALPVGPDFPDWRAPESPAVLDWLAWPFDGIAFDIENDDFWWEFWGPRPTALPEAVAVARAAVELAPRLIPIVGHRYLPAEPHSAGNPVFSVVQTDVIHYGVDLRRYLSCEFGGLPHEDAVRGARRRIRFWSDLVDRNA